MNQTRITYTSISETILFNGDLYLINSSITFTNFMQSIIFFALCVYQNSSENKTTSCKYIANNTSIKQCWKKRKVLRSSFLLLITAILCICIYVSTFVLIMAMLTLWILGIGPGLWGFFGIRARFWFDICVVLWTWYLFFTFHNFIWSLRTMFYLLWGFTNNLIRSSRTVSYLL